MSKDRTAEADDGKPDIKVSPGMRQYLEIKARHPDAILFFHIGDFYETFGADAEVISRELELVLTSRSKGGDEKVPLAGVPYHAADGYIARLVAKGYKVAVCDQLEDAKKAKGLVRRDVVRVITPGTVIDASMLPTTDARYLMAVCPAGINRQEGGLSFLDISTGEFFVTGIPQDSFGTAVLSEIARYRPSECIVPETIDGAVCSAIEERGVSVRRFRSDAFDPESGRRALLAHFHVISLAGYGCEGMPYLTGAAAAAISYAKEMQNSDLNHIRSLSVRPASECMLLDAVTLRNLEVAESIRAGQKGSTLLSCLNFSKTAMGNRLLRVRLTRPLLDVAAINARLDAVAFFVDNGSLRLALRPLLSPLSDIERIAGRISFGNAGPRDLIALAESLEALPSIRNVLSGLGQPIPARVEGALKKLADMEEVISLIRRAVVTGPPPNPRNGGVIREGYSSELDGIRTVLRGGKDWVAELQNRERELTGIRSLKIGYNRIFGYYIDVTRTNLHLVPGRYERKQTTATGERFTTPELREKELLINSADERVLALERDLYAALVAALQPRVAALQEISDGIAEIDLCSALAEAAVAGGYVRPIVDDKDRIVIRDGRHPVVERSVETGFVPNDADLSGSGVRILIITGANMAGKSTYMRAVALTCIMAQAGSFVPASHAAIGVVDRIFTRVGAFDDLASGQSTFMVEMLELANILNNVTPRSLVILDEIGRGTSTADGYAIAQSVLEYLHGKSRQAGPKTLFATHFHELIGIETDLRHTKNYHFAVKETKQEVIFLRKLIPGATDRSYGVHVARLAGIPSRVTARSDEILKDTLNGNAVSGRKVQRYTQLLLSDDSSRQEPRKAHPVLAELQHIDPDSMTPMQALLKLQELKNGLDTEEETE